jgi:hypothetical protein
MKKSSIILYIAFGVLLVLLIYGIKLNKLKPDAILTLFILAVAIGVLSIFSEIDYAKPSNVLYEEVGGRNKKDIGIGFFVFGGGILFTFVFPMFTESAALIFSERVIGVFGFLLAVPLIFSKNKIVLMEAGFMLLDPLSRIRNKIKFYRDRSVMSYSSLESYGENDGKLEFCFKSSSLPNIGPVPFSLVFVSKNPKKIIKILKSKGISKKLKSMSI